MSTDHVSQTTAWQDGRFYWVRVRRLRGRTPQKWDEGDWEVGQWVGYWDLVHDEAIYDDEFDRVVVHPHPLEPPDVNETNPWQPLESAPRDGTWVELRCINQGYEFKMYWEPTMTSWVDGELRPTGCWTDDDGWLQPDEVDGWRQCP